MTSIFPGVISKRLNSVAVTANVGNVHDLYVRGAGAAANVLVTDAAFRVVGSNVSAASLAFLNGVTAPIQAQLDAKAGSSGGRLAANAVVVGNSLVLSGAAWAADSVLVVNATGNVVTTNVSTAELQFLDGLAAPLVTSLAAKANALTGAATTIAYADLAADRALLSTAAGKVAVSATTAAELGYLAGATGGVQAQLDARANIAGAAFTGAVSLASQTASRAVALDASRNLVAATATLAELNYVSGLTSSAQAQLNGKANLAGPVAFASSVTIAGNLTVQGNLVTMSSEQVVAKDPIVLLNTDRVAGTSGLYMQQQNGANVAMVYQGGNVGLFTTPSNSASATLVVGSYVGLNAGSAALQGSLTIVPPASANGYMCSMSTATTPTGTTHTVPASVIDAANGGSGIFGGQLMVWVTNNATDNTNKTGYATVSLLKTPPDFDVVPISVHRNVNLAQFDVGKSVAGTDVVILTDSDCKVSWKFDGSTIR